MIKDSIGILNKIRTQVPIEELGAFQISGIKLIEAIELAIGDEVSVTALMDIISSKSNLAEFVRSLSSSEFKNEIEKILQYESDYYLQIVAFPMKCLIDLKIDIGVADMSKCTGLPDSNSNLIKVNDKVRAECDSDLHGDWVVYEVQQRGLTPVLSYLYSEKGQVLKVGYSVGALCNEYDPEDFSFAEDISKISPLIKLEIIS